MTIPDLGLPKHENEILLADAHEAVIGKTLSRLELYTQNQWPKEVLALARKWAERRKEGEALQLVVGSTFFRNHRYSVASGVFIPRPETEVLVDKALELIPFDQKLNGYEFGVGTGIVSIEILLERPLLRMVASDVNSTAIDLARKNAKAWGVLNRMDLILFEGRESVFPTLQSTSVNSMMKFDFMVANPPYLDLEDEISDEVLKNDPIEALMDHEGKSYFEKLAEQSRIWLKSGGFLVLEISHQKAAKIEALFRGKGFDISLVQDLTGRDRVAIAWIKFES